MNIRRQLTATAELSQSSDYSLADLSESPRSILEKIIWHKEKEVAQMASAAYRKELERQISKRPPTKNFTRAITQANSESGVGLIAEVKKASPSKGVIRPNFNPVEIAKGYAQGGAACLSVLTDQLFFQGSFKVLSDVRRQINLPILCKEFIISPYQVLMARAVGADALLLIAAVLCDSDLRMLFELASSLGMQSLIEVHTLGELDRVMSLLTPDMVGINNRNLETFKVDLGNTQRLLAARGNQLKAGGVTVISESGIFTPADIAQVEKAGAQGILVGEALVKQPNVEQAVRSLLQTNSLEKVFA
jgi:indole-3-glycerol phosphate synthase